MRVLVTGAAGFIGSHLCELLIEQDYHVVGVDNFSVGRESNLKLIKNSMNFEFYKCDISSGDSLNEIEGDFDFVFHLAALADIVPSIEVPMDYMKVNVMGTVNVLERTKSPKLRKFVYAASSSCYGVPLRYPTKENSPINTEYPYALSKYLGEQSVLHWGKVYRMPVLSLRLFNVYGPRVRTSGTYGAVFGVFLAQRANGFPLTIVGDGNQTRDFTFVTDVAKAFLLAAESSSRNLCLNVGSGGTYSINHLASLIGGKTVSIPTRPGEPDCTFADTQLIRDTLAWKPEVTFEEGVRKLVSDIGQWENAPVWNPETISEATDLWFKYLGPEN
jgi:UDP-glucose 4-epimerase